MHIIQIPLWVAQTNCWIVSSSQSAKECIVIDAPPDPSAILSALSSNGKVPRAIIATHGHVDHIGGIAELTRSFPDSHKQPIPTHIHQADVHLLIDPIGNSGLLGDELKKLNLNFDAPELINFVAHGDQIKGSGLTFSAIHTPGHTQGSTCFILSDESTSEKVLFTGDHLFKGSVGRTDLPGGSFDDLVESMKSRILPLSDELLILPGHGPSTRLGIEKETNPFILQMK